APSACSVDELTSIWDDVASGWVRQATRRVEWKEPGSEVWTFTSGLPPPPIPRGSPRRTRGLEYTFSISGLVLKITTERPLSGARARIEWIYSGSCAWVGD